MPIVKYLDHNEAYTVSWQKIQFNWKHRTVGRPQKKAKTSKCLLYNEAHLCNSNDIMTTFKRDAKLYIIPEEQFAFETSPTVPYCVE